MKRHHKGLWKPRNRIMLVILTYRYWWDTSAG